jgi:hypothetical protein
MNNKFVTLNRSLTLLMGIALPVTQAVRIRMNALENWPFWANDYFLGAFLLFAFWKSKRDHARGQQYLAAAWGVACGMLYMSFFSHLVRSRGPFSNAGISNDILTALVGLGFIISIIGMILSLLKTHDLITPTNP